MQKNVVSSNMPGSATSSFAETVKHKSTFLFQTVVNPACLDLGSFQIRPSVFEILAGRTVMIELIFTPEQVKKYQEELVVVCDNCQIMHFTLHGELDVRYKII